MISIKKFLSPDSEKEQVFLHVVRTLVSGIGEHAAAGENDESARFREKIEKISGELVDVIPAAELLVRSDAVLKCLEDHTRSAMMYQRLQTSELQAMVRMLTSTVSSIASASDANVCILGQIEKQVANVSELEDVRVVKARLSDCLNAIREESSRQRIETGATIQQLNEVLSNARKSGAGQLKDLTTGLLQRPEAETVLAEFGRPGSAALPAYATVMVLDRLQTVNARFGRETGDEMLVEFTQLVQTHLQPEDMLFRWSGPVLLAILRRTGSLDFVRSEVARLMETPLEHSIQTQSRSLMIPIAARWTIFPVMAAPRLNYNKIDSFAGAPAGRGH